MTLRFTPDLLERPPATGIDAVTKLQHFSIITYGVDPDRVRPYVDERFAFDTYPGPDGSPRVWVSVVPFIDVDFHFARLPMFQFQMGQTNYRTYVIDTETGERAVWFFGTTLDSWTIVIPRGLWRMPWHRGGVSFDAHFDRATRRYRHYRMRTLSDWAAVELELSDTGQQVRELPGIDDLEDGLVRLTHPTIGVYYRRDGSLGSYRIWHDRLYLTEGEIIEARFDLLDRLAIVPYEDQYQPHSVLIQRQTEFIVHLPPVRIAGKSDT